MLQQGHMRMKGKASHAWYAMLGAVRQVRHAFGGCFPCASDVCPTPVGSQIVEIDNSAASNSFCLDVSLDVVVFFFHSSCCRCTASSVEASGPDFMEGPALCSTPVSSLIRAVLPRGISGTWDSAL